jgi:hypothetical protein
MSEMVFDMTDMTRQISKLNLEKCDGPSLIPTVLIKRCGLFSRIQLDMKVSSVTSVHKPNKPNNSITSYRPVSVSNNLMKIFESLLYNNFNSFITCNHTSSTSPLRYIVW